MSNNRQSRCVFIVDNEEKICLVKKLLLDGFQSQLHTSMSVHSFHHNMFASYYLFHFIHSHDCKGNGNAVAGVIQIRFITFIVVASMYLSWNETKTMMNSFMHNRPRELNCHLSHRRFVSKCHKKYLMRIAQKAFFLFLFCFKTMK